jgi:hypothetical protein
MGTRCAGIPSMTTTNASDVSPKIARLERKLAKRQKQLDSTKAKLKKAKATNSRNGKAS